MVSYNKFAVRAARASIVDKQNQRIDVGKFVFLVAVGGDENKLCKIGICDDESNAKLAASKAKAGAYGTYDTINEASLAADGVTLATDTFTKTLFSGLFTGECWKNYMVSDAPAAGETFIGKKGTVRGVLVYEYGVCVGEYTGEAEVHAAEEDGVDLKFVFEGKERIMTFLCRQRGVSRPRRASKPPKGGPDVAIKIYANRRGGAGFTAGFSTADTIGRARRLRSRAARI
jgi:hypothetical protein